MSRLVICHGLVLLLLVTTLVGLGQALRGDSGLESHRGILQVSRSEAKASPLEDGAELLHDEDHVDEHEDEHDDEHADEDHEDEELKDVHEDEHHNEHEDEHHDEHADEDHEDEELKDVHEDEHHDEHEEEDHGEHADEDHEDEELKDVHDDEHHDEHEDEHHDEHADEDHEDEELEDVHDDEHHDEHEDAHHDEHADEDHQDEELKDIHDDEHHDEHEDEHHDEHEDEHHDEDAVGHLLHAFGGNEAFDKTGVNELIHMLISECGESDDAHAHHGHGHGHSGGLEKMTADYLIERYGDEGRLDSNSLIQACPDILRCQVDSECELTEEEAAPEEHEDVKQLKILAASVFVVEAAIGTVLPMVLGTINNYQMWLTVLNCFSGGVFMAAGFIHMVPHIVENQAGVNGLDGYPLGPLIIVIGFILVLFVEHVLLDVQIASNNILPSKEEKSKELAPAPEFHHISRPREEPNTRSKSTSKTSWITVSHAAVILMAISVHALLEALALGLETKKTGVLLLLATIGSHKGVASMALSARFIQSGATKKQVFIFMTIFAAIAPIGIGIGLATEGVGPLTLVVLDSLAAGSFIYVGAYEVISEEFPHHVKTNDDGEESSRAIKAGKFMCVVAGVLVIALLQLIPHN